MRGIMTVLGPVAVEDMGFTLTHEHVFFNTSLWEEEPQDARTAELAAWPITLETVGEIRRDPTLNRENLRFSDLDIAVRELDLYREAGGKTILDVNPIKVTFPRRPDLLQEVSKATGVNIVMGSGYYVAASHPPEVEKFTAEQIAAAIAAEWRDGVGDSGVRPGVIGEIGCSGGLHPEEIKVLRAAAMAQSETGLGIVVHPPVPYGKAGLRIVEILSEAGADTSRVVIGHMYHSIADLDYHRRVADTGATIAYDRLGAEFYWETWDGGDFHNPGGRGGYREPLDWDVCDAIATLVREGYTDRISLSHDIAYRLQLRTFGGTGFAHILNHVLPRLRAIGVSDADIDQMVVRNPARLFTLDL